MDITTKIVDTIFALAILGGTASLVFNPNLTGAPTWVATLITTFVAVGVSYGIYKMWK